MNQIKLFLQSEHLGNSGMNYLMFITAIILGLLFKGLISKYLSRSLYRIIGRKEKRVGVEKFDELLTNPIAFFIMLSAIYIGVNQLSFQEEWKIAPVNEFGIRMILSKGFALIYIYSIFLIVKRIIAFFGILLQKRAEETGSSRCESGAEFQEDHLGRDYTGAIRRARTFGKS